jgi:hypothetical protein
VRIYAPAREMITPLDVPPLCLSHQVRMVPDSEEEPRSSPELRTQSYRCPAPACDLNWERRLGYFKTATNQQTFQFGIDGKRCPTPGHFFLYLGESVEGGKTRVWRCAVEHCRHIHTESI